MLKGQDGWEKTKPAMEDNTMKNRIRLLQRYKSE